jgi:hypothetical protein
MDYSVPLKEGRTAVAELFFTFINRNITINKNKRYADR